MGINTEIFERSVQKITKVIGSSVKKSGVKASASERQAMAFKENNVFMTNVFEHFSQKPEMTKDELQALLKNHYPNIDVRVVQSGGKNAGTISPKIEKDVVTHYEFQMPFTKNSLGEDVLSADRKTLLAHENQHMEDLVHNPSYLSNLFKEVMPRSEQRLVDHFYDNYLYKRSFNIPDVTNEMTTNKLRTIAMQTNGSLGMVRATPEQRIKIMQDWRKRLQTERNAISMQETVHFVDISKKVKDGTIVSELSPNATITKEEFLNIMTDRYVKNPQQTLKEERGGVLKMFFYDEKIAILKDMLKRDMKLVRNKHKASLGVTA